MAIVWTPDAGDLSWPTSLHLQAGNATSGLNQIITMNNIQANLSNQTSLVLPLAVVNSTRINKAYMNVLVNNINALFGSTLVCPPRFGPTFIQQLRSAMSTFGGSRTANTYAAFRTDGPYGAAVTGFDWPNGVTSSIKIGKSSNAANTPLILRSRSGFIFDLTNLSGIQLSSATLTIKLDDIVTTLESFTPVLYLSNTNSTVSPSWWLDEDNLITNLTVTSSPQVISVPVSLLNAQVGSSVSFVLITQEEFSTSGLSVSPLGLQSSGANLLVNPVLNFTVG